MRDTHKAHKRAMGDIRISPSRDIHYTSTTMVVDIFFYYGIIWMIFSQPPDELHATYTLYAINEIYTIFV